MIVTPHSALCTPHSALRTPHSALRTRQALQKNHFSPHLAPRIATELNRSHLILPRQGTPLSPQDTHRLGVIVVVSAAAVAIVRPHAERPSQSTARPPLKDPPDETADLDLAWRVS